MTTEENLNVSRRFFTEFLGKGDLKIGDEVLDKNVRAITGLKPDGAIEGAKNTSKYSRSFMTLFRRSRRLQLKIFSR